jgi:hypothetical protein
VSPFSQSVELRENNDKLMQEFEKLTGRLRVVKESLDEGNEALDRLVLGLKQVDKAISECNATELVGAPEKLNEQAKVIAALLPTEAGLLFLMETSEQNKLPSSNKKSEESNPWLEAAKPKINNNNNSTNSKKSKNNGAKNNIIQEIVLTTANGKSFLIPANLAIFNPPKTLESFVISSKLEGQIGK